MDVHLAQLRYFATLAESRTFSEAARRCYISPSALSQSLRVLERRVKATLIERHAKRVSLTPAGRRFLERCRRALEIMDGAGEDLEDRPREVDPPGPLQPRP